jgi:hypothetical protein
VSDAGAGGSLVAQWTPAEFFVPPSLWGARIGTQFLDNLLAVLGRRGFGECKVTITPDATRSDPGFRAEQLGMIEFYRGAGFKVIRQNADAVVLMRVCPRAAATPPAPAAPAAGARIS